MFQARVGVTCRTTGLRDRAVVYDGLYCGLRTWRQRYACRAERVVGSSVYYRSLSGGRSRRGGLSLATCLTLGSILVRVC